MYCLPTRRNLKRFSTAFSMKKTSRDRPPRRSVFIPGFTIRYTCLTQSNHSVADILAASSSLSIVESNRRTRMTAKHLIFNAIIVAMAFRSRLLSDLHMAVQIRWLKNLQLLEILFSYFNTLCRGKSLTLHLCKMYEREVCFLR